MPEATTDNLCCEANVLCIIYRHMLRTLAGDNRAVTQEGNTGSGTGES